MVFAHNVTQFLRCLVVTGIFVHVKRRRDCLSMKLIKVWKEGSTTIANASFGWKVDSKYVKFGNAIGGREWKTMLMVLGTIFKLHILPETDFRKQVDWGHQERLEVRRNWLLNWSTWTFERKVQWNSPYFQELWHQFGMFRSAQEGFCTWK